MNLASIWYYIDYFILFVIFLKFLAFYSHDSQV